MIFQVNTKQAPQSLELPLLEQPGSKLGGFLCL